MTNSQYYTAMTEGFKPSMTFDELHKKWFKCFSYILKNFNADYTDNSIKDLFYGFNMGNWDLLRLSDSKYFNDDDEQMFNHFAGECNYICDRTSYDRLFRTHWFFLIRFRNEMNEKVAKYYSKKMKK